MRNKLLIVFFIIFALPIPIAVIGSIISFVWFIYSITNTAPIAEIIMAFFGIIIGSSYIVTYVYSLKKTKEEKAFSRKTFLPAVHCIAALLFLLLLNPVSKYADNSQERFGFKKKDFTVVDELDTHGGFLGDGSYYLILDCSQNREKALEKVAGWKKLPLSENLDLIMYGGNRDGVGYSYNLAEEAGIPKIENGYYFFEDRHSESNNSEDDSELFDRYSFNFSIAIYDSDTDKLYYFDFDT